MKPQQKSEFVQLTSLFILVRIGDGISTYLASPDLRWELNPIVSLLGYGWGGLFLANILMIGLVVFLNYFQLAIYKQPEMDVLLVKNPKQFYSMLYFNRPDKFIWSFYRLPARWKPALNHLGFILPRMMIFSGIIIIANNLMGALQFQPYLDLMRLWKYSWLILYIIPLLYLIALYIKKVKLEYSLTITDTN